MKLYTCTIQNRDHFADDHESPCCLVGSVTVAARNERAAAAKAYFRLVGRHRLRMLKRLKAPSFIIYAETDHLGLACGLVRKGRGPEGGRVYVHDNMVEAWDIEVVPASAAMERAYGELMQRPRCLAKCVASRALRHPSIN